MKTDQEWKENGKKKRKNRWKDGFEESSLPCQEASCVCICTKKQEENQSLTSDFNGGCCVWKKGDCRRKKKKESSPKGGRDEEEKTERWQIQNLSEMGGHRELKIS